MEENMTRLPRRCIIAALALITLHPPIGARAQSYPTRPITIIVPLAAGTGMDTVVRLYGDELSKSLGQSVVVDNRPGAATMIGTDAVAKAAPDGYTLLLTTSADAWNETLYDNLNFHVPADFTPVATISRGAGVLVVNPSVPATSVPQLIAYANANPGKVTAASAGVGSAPHMFWELFRSVTGVDMVHVPYRGGGPAVTDLLGGQVMVYFGTFASTIENVRAGRLRALAVTSATRAAVLPDVPTMAEFFPGFEASIYVGIAAPRGTPAEIVETLNMSMRMALEDAAMKKRIAELGDMPLSLSTADFAKLVDDETEKWRKVIKTAHLRAE
jgi:tripartite-type tricarboxylate transporter receptor subunit TctC